MNRVSKLAMGLVVLAAGCGGGGKQPGAHDAHPHAHHKFDDAERWAKVFDNPARDAWQKPAKVVQLLALSPTMTVVDLGAGTGYFESYLAPAVPDGRVLALDIEPTLVEHMAARFAREQLTNAEARVVAPDDPGLLEASVDRILIVDTWHHIDDRVAYARKLRHGLRPGGAIFVIDFTPETPRGPPPAARIAAAVVVSELREAGLSAEIIAERLPDQYVVRARLLD